MDLKCHRVCWYCGHVDHYKQECLQKRHNEEIARIAREKVNEKPTKIKYVAPKPRKPKLVWVRKN